MWWIVAIIAVAWFAGWLLLRRRRKDDATELGALSQSWLTERRSGRGENGRGDL